MGRRVRLTEYEQPPEAPSPDGPPGTTGFLSEWRASWQLVRLLAASPRLARMPRSDGAPVILVPGWRAPEATVVPLWAYLRWLGYDARPWGLGRNLGDPGRNAARLAGRVSTLAEAAARPVALVGWSLGGVVARETARLVPGDVSRVITYGTPAVGGPTHTVGARSWGTEECARISELVARLDREHPIEVPITAIFTRRDGAVAWSACIDRANADVRHHEVTSTHLGMGVDPDVWIIVAAALAASRGRQAGQPLP